MTDISSLPPKTYLDELSRYDANTLLLIIQRIVRPNTTIHFDEWAAYERLRELGYVHNMDIHSVTFVDILSGTYTQHFESHWNNCKHRIKVRRGIEKYQLQYYISKWNFKNLFK